MCLTRWDPMDCSPLGSCLWSLPGKNTGVGCHFPFQGLNSRLRHLLHWQVDSLPLWHQEALSLLHQLRHWSLERRFLNVYVCAGLIPLHDWSLYMNLPCSPRGRNWPVHLTTSIGRLAEQELCPPVSRSSLAPSFPDRRGTAVPLRLSASSSLTSTCAWPLNRSFLSGSLLSAVSAVSSGLLGVAFLVCICRRAPAPQLPALLPTLLSAPALSFHGELTPAPPSWFHRALRRTITLRVTEPQSAGSPGGASVPPLHVNCAGRCWSAPSLLCLRGWERGEGCGRWGWKGEQVCVIWVGAPGDSVTAPLEPWRTRLSTLALFVKSHFSLTLLIKLATQSLLTASQKYLPCLMPPFRSLSPQPHYLLPGELLQSLASRSLNLQALSAPIHLAHCCQINLPKQCFLNFGVHENHLGSLLKIQMPWPLPID